MKQVLPLLEKLNVVSMDMNYFRKLAWFGLIVKPDGEDIVFKELIPYDGPHPFWICFTLSLGFIYSRLLKEGYIKVVEENQESEQEETEIDER